jgi:SAM-dependent MidA family methyltransferase
MGAALYGADGFFTAGDTGPAGHFRTSVHASPLFGAALLRLIEQVDAALGWPASFEVVDVGAGRGELLTTLRGLMAGSALAGRVGLVGVELAERPAELDRSIGWRRDVPESITGMLIATEWLDNVPLDVAEVDEDGLVRRVLVDPVTGVETLGEGIDAADAYWLARWWPLGSPTELRADSATARYISSEARADDGSTRDIPPRTRTDDEPAHDSSSPTPTDEPMHDASRNVQGEDGSARGIASEGRAGGTLSGARAEGRWARGAVPGARAEVGWSRDSAWAEAVGSVRRGVALAVDYGHVRGGRPVFGSLTGFRGGRQVVPVPDGSCDVTAHVAMDAVAVAAGTPYTLITQREALKALGVGGGRPPLDLARTEPAEYLRALAAAGAAAELLDPAGLGGHWWLLHTIGIDNVGSFRRD